MSDAQEIVDVATRATEPQPLDPTVIYSVVLPDGGHKVIDLDSFLDAPRRKKGAVSIDTGDSLAQYVKAHAAAGTALFADMDGGAVTAVLNGHSDQPGWGDHRATLRFRQTPAWDRWKSKDRQLLSQVAFAEHIEEGLGEVVEPPGAEMLELAQSFQAATKVNFKSSRMLDTGQRQLMYEETIDAKAGQKGEITIPKEFTLALAPYEGCAPYKVIARLRFRMKEGDLSLGYVLDRPNEVLRSAFDDEVVKVETATGLTAYRGRP